MPWTGPTLLSLRPFKDSNENMEATLDALQGVSLSSRPDLWQPYAAGVPDVMRVAKSIATLKSRFPDQAAEIDAALQGKTQNPQAVVFVPLAGRKSFWTVFIDPVTAEVITAMPLDSF